MFGKRLAPVVQDLLESMPMPMVHDAGGGVTYHGYTESLGVGFDEPKWLIIRITVSAGVTTPEYANGKASFENSWNDRLTLTYRR